MENHKIWFFRLYMYLSICNWKYLMMHIINKISWGPLFINHPSQVHAYWCFSLTRTPNLKLSSVLLVTFTVLFVLVFQCHRKTNNHVGKPVITTTQALSKNELNKVKKHWFSLVRGRRDCFFSVDAESLQEEIPQINACVLVVHIIVYVCVF